MRGPQESMYNHDNEIRELAREIDLAINDDHKTVDGLVEKLKSVGLRLSGIGTGNTQNCNDSDVTSDIQRSVAPSDRLESTDIESTCLSTSNDRPDTEHQSAGQATLKKFNAFFYLNPCPMTVSILPERTFVDVNEAFLSTLGYSRDEVIGKSSAELDLFVDPESVEEMVRQMRETGSVKKLEMRVRSKKGALLCGLFSGEAINVDGQQYFLSAMLGITELKRLEIELKESEEKYRELAESSPDWIWVTDSQAVLTYSSPAVKKMLGYEVAEVLGTSLLRYIHPEDSQRVVGSISRGLAEKRGWTNQEVRSLHADGSVCIFESSGVPTIDSDGNVTGFRGVDRDITDKKAIQAEWKRNADLFELVVNQIEIPIGVSSGVHQHADYLNPKWTSLFGYTLDEMPSISEWWPLAYPDEDYRAEVADEWNRRVVEAIRSRSQIDPMETMVTCKDGSRRIIEWGVVSTGDWNVVHGVDLTEHRSLERQLRDSEEKFRKITETSPNWIWLSDSDMKFTYSNPSLYQLLGYRPEEVIGVDAFELVHPDDREKLKTLIKGLMELKQGWDNVEFKSLHKNGSVVVMESSGVHFLDDEGSIVGFMAIVHDITAKKLLEEERKRNAEELQLIFDKLPIPIALSVGLEQFSRYHNPVWLRVFGYETSKMPTVEEWWPLAYPDEQYRDWVSEEWKSRVEAAVKDHSAIEPMETVVTCYDGSEKTISWGLVSTGDSNVVFGIDLTERKRLEEDLRKSEEKYRDLTETIPDWIWEVDSLGVVTYTNRAVENLTGYAPDEIMGRNAFDFIHPDDRESMRNLLRKCTDEGTGWSHVEKRWIHRDGAIRTFEAAGVPIFDKTGSLTGFRGVDRDITQRKRLETERLEIQQKLLHAQKFESLAVMAGGIAHDFNNLLMGVMGNLELALEFQNLDPKLGRYIQTALNAAERSAELSSKMLIYSGSAIYLPKELNLKDLMLEMELTLRSIVTKDTALHLMVDQGLLMVRGSKEQLQQMVKNLVINASESFGEEPGRVTLTAGIVECDERYLAQSRLDEKPPPGRFVFLEVEDNGCGMDDEGILKLFDPFFTTKFWGRGLGLPEVIGIVKAHRGAIIVKSYLERGTSIRVLIPEAVHSDKRSAESSESSGQRTVQTTSPKRVVKVLVVDDEELVRGMIMERLQVLGLDTVLASDGEEAVSIYRNRSTEIDLVMLDFLMPNMNGAEAFHKLVEINPDVKVILNTGYSEESVLEMFGDRRPDAILCKPYNLQTLKDKIKSVLNVSIG